MFYSTRVRQKCALLLRWKLLSESAEESQLLPCAHQAVPTPPAVPLTSHCSWPSALTALPSSTLLPPVPSCLPSGTSVLLLCFPGPPSQIPFTFLCVGGASATLGRGQQSFFGWRLLGSVCRREACLALIGATGNLWAPIMVGRAALLAILSPVPHQLFLPLSLAVPLDLCHSH